MLDFKSSFSDKIQDFVTVSTGFRSVFKGTGSDVRFSRIGLFGLMNSIKRKKEVD